MQFKKKNTDSATALLADITHLYSDHTDRLWLRHFDQLVAFENEKVAKNIPCISDSAFLFNTKIVRDNDNNYWVGPTLYGIIRYSDNFKTAKIFRCAPKVYNTTCNDVIINKNGEVCVLYTTGIGRFNKQKHRFEYFPANWAQITRSASPLEHLTFLHDNNNSYWIGTNAGLINVNIATKQYQLYKNTANDTILTSNNILCLFSDRSNNIWVGTDNGITIFSPDKNVIKIKSTIRNGLYSNYIYTIYQDFSDNIWIGTSEGLNKLQKSRFVQWPLPCYIDGDVKAFIEPGHTIWYAGNKDVLIKQNYLTGETWKYEMEDSEYKNGNSSGEEFICNAIIVDKDRVWLAVNDYVEGFNKKAKLTDKKFRINAVVSGRDSIRNKILALHEDKQGAIWIIALNGVVQYNPATNRMLKFIPFNNNTTPLYNIDLNYVKGMACDLHGNIYIRTPTHILQLNTLTYKLVSVFNANKLNRQWIHEGDISADANGNIWFASLPELYKYSPSLNRVETFSFPSTFETGYCNIVPDVPDIWVYSNNGLLVYNLKTGIHKSYGYDDGLPDNTINSLIPDARHNVWVSTNKGLSCFNPKDGTFSNYYTPFDDESYAFKNIPNSEGLPLREIIFFTNNKLFYVDADNINTHPPQVIITGIRLFGNELVTDSLVYQKKFLPLKYNQNFLTFTFSALDYASPGKNKFAYKLEGLDSNWHYVDASGRIAEYTSLPPGKYTFVVKACNSDQVWNEKGACLYILITPPWYKTDIAYALYIISGLLLFYAILKIRERRLIREKHILEQKVNERTHTISQQNKEISEQRDQISQQNKNITDSILYAKQIQSALLPPKNLFGQYFSDFLVLYRPRDIVSGDFYWLTEKDGNIVVVVADCTGHGVPGALMSMLGISVLTDIVGKMEDIRAADILDQLRDKIIFLLHQSEDLSSSKDGMDISVCVYSPRHKLLQFAGAFNSLYLFKNDEYMEINADRQPIGYYDNVHPFANHEMSVSDGDVFYLLSDGYVDQFHYESNEKFKTRRFREMIKEIHPLSLKQQNKIFQDRITEWIGTGDQIDDITIVGIRV
jgi:ligand-binding sensor domain-containing protein/serine phosphatase RsbU (regulator of sigma subunit)